MDDLTDLKVRLLTTKQIDLHGRQIVNAGDAVNAQDYVTKAQLDAAIEKLRKEFKNGN